MSRIITQREAALSAAMQEAMAELEAATEPRALLLGRAPPFAQRAWRILQDAAIALEQEVAACPACGEFLLKLHACSDPACGWGQAK